MSLVLESPRIKKTKLTALVLLVVSGMINYIDRATLAIANPLIREDLGLSIADMGLLLSAFYGPTPFHSWQPEHWLIVFGRD
jgi:sugar phosphate permease